MANTNHHITIRTNGRLINWKGYKNYEEASRDFIGLVDHYNEVTDGAFLLKDDEHITFGDEQGHTITLQPTDDKLIMDIIFNNDRLMDEIFENFLSNR